MNSEKGIFISFEGPDGSGKTTQLHMLGEHCSRMGMEVLTTREPGGTPISEKIRSLILDPDNSEMDPRAEALLYAASRAQLTAQVIRPALDAGKIVLCDRFMDSSIAYQGYGRGLGDGVRMINEFGISNLLPDLTFFLDIDPKEGRKRNDHDGKNDRMEHEALAFHRKVHEGYIDLSRRFPERIIRIDASEPAERVFSRVKELFDKYVTERS